MKNLVAKKSLGQHFLRSEKALQQIKETVTGEFPIFEIGPGEGVLTEKLLGLGGEVYVIEIDKRSIELLKEKFVEQIKNKKLFIIEEDCLQVDYYKYAEKYFLVGNIPYYITGAIFRHTFEQKVLPISVTFLVQKEVAQRIVAKDKKESILSISVKIFADGLGAKIVDIVKAGSFSPAPKVDSAILQISNIKKINNYEKFFEVMKAAFKQKRKFALSNIKHILGEDMAEKMKKYFSEKERAEDVGLETWKKIIKEI